MCHLLLLLPVVTLPVLWLLPPSVSVPLYALAVAVALALYYGVVKAMRRPVMLGREQLVGAHARVVEAENGRLAVAIGAERWSARSEEGRLGAGDRVRVVGVEGLTLTVVGEQRQARFE